MKILSHGFTLIELLIVISIIGALSAIGLYTSQGGIKKARDAQRYADLDRVRTALELYYNQNDQYPVTGLSTFWSVCAGGGSHDNTGANGYIPNLAPTFISSLPTDPLGCTGGDYQGYIYKSDGKDYKLATDWSAEVGAECGVGKGFYDSRCGSAATCAFCSISTPGATGW